MIRTTVATPPVLEPVDLTTAKKHAKVEVSDDDTLLAVYIQAAREIVEAFVSRSLVETVWNGYLDEFPDFDDRDCGAIVLTFPPLISVQSVKYLPADGGAEATVSASDYVVDDKSQPGRIVLKPDKSWPATLVVPNAVRIQWTAGYGNDPADVPAALREAVLVLVADMYDNRSPVPTALATAQMRQFAGPFVLGRIW